MTQVETRAKQDRPADGWPTEPSPQKARGSRFRVLPLLITLATLAVAGLLGWAMWDAYMVAPWTRDATVRAYVVPMASYVAGRIVDLPVVANQYVRKGSLLMVIDPTDYNIAVSQAEAAVRQAQANIRNIEAQIDVQQAQVSVAQAQVDQAQAALVFAQQQAKRYQYLAQQDAGSVQNAQQYASQLREQQAALTRAEANLKLAQQQVEALRAQRISAEATLTQVSTKLHQAQVNLQRTRIVSPVDGYVTNLLAQVGDYVNVGVNIVSVVGADSFWVDGYFEETNLASIHVGDPAKIKLMGYGQLLHGHVESIARAINVPNAEPDKQGVASVNPIFTWVRLAQRIPVHIHLDEVPKGVQLVAGMTATVQIDYRP